MAAKKKAATPKQEKPPKEPRAPKAAAPSRKAVREKPGLGHNSAEFREKVLEYTKAYLAKKEAMEADMAGYRSEINTIYEEGANALGLKKSVFSAELKRLERLKKEYEKAQKLAADEREQTEMWRAAHVGHQFELFVAGELPPVPTGTVVDPDDGENGDPD